MIKLRALYFQVLLAVLAALMLSSCVSPDASIPAKNEFNDTRLKLRFMSSWGGVDSKAGTLQDMLNNFMDKNPDIEVINESLFGEDFLPKIKTDFASGNDPDVFGLWPGSDIRALVKAGKVADLTGVIFADNDWRNSFGKEAWSYTTFEKRIYGLPLEIIFEGLFINRDLFEKHDVKIPHNYDELKNAVSKFKEKGIIPIAYNSFAEGTFIYQNIVAELGSKEEVENPFTDGRVNGCYIDGMVYVKELYDMGAFPPDMLSLNNDERNSLFRDKKAAMIVQGSWFIGDFQDDDGTVDIIPFPRFGVSIPRSYTMIYGLGCGAFYMSKSAWSDDDKRLASLKLLRALTSREAACMLANNTGMISNVDISGYDVRYNRLTKKGLELINNARALVGPPDSFVNRSVWEKVIVKDFPYVLEGKKTPEKLWDEAIKQGIITH